MMDVNFTTHATFLPLEGDVQSKNKMFKDIPWRKFLARRRYTYDIKGMPSSYLKPKWKNMMLFLHIYITYEC